MDSATPDFKVEPLKLHAVTPTLKITAVAVGLLVVAGILYVIFGRAPFSERNVTLTINTPSSISSGDAVIYKIQYENKNRSALTHARITFTYPPDAVPLKGGNVSTQLSESVILDTIAGHSSGEQSFTALVVGSQGNVRTARATLTYNPENLTTELRKTVDSAITIASLPIQLTAVAPPTVLNGQTLTYIVDYRDQTAEPIANIRIQMQYPEGFTIISVTPKTTGLSNGLNRQVYWDIPMIAPGEGGRITLQGTVQGREKDAKTLSVLLKRQLDTPAGAVYVNLESTQVSSVIATPLLSAVISVQDTTSYTAHVSDLLQYKIFISNNSDVDLSSLTLTAQLEGTMYDLSTAQSAGAFDSRTRIFLWNSAVVPELGLLRAHQSVTVPFSLRVKPTFPSVIGTKDSLLKASVHLETVNVPDVFQVDTLSANDQIISKLSTSMAFNGELKSMVAPHVDQKTPYIIHLTLANPFNDIAPAKVSAVLLPGVSWDSAVQVAGTQIQPAYDLKTSTVTWNIGSVPSGVGVAFPAFELYFQVAVVPSINQVQQTIPLVKDITFEGTDMLTKEKIVETVRDFSSSSVLP